MWFRFYKLKSRVEDAARGWATLGTVRHSRVARNARDALMCSHDGSPAPGAWWRGNVPHCSTPRARSRLVTGWGSRVYCNIWQSEFSLVYDYFSAVTQVFRITFHGSRIKLYVINGYWNRYYFIEFMTDLCVSRDVNHWAPGHRAVGAACREARGHCRGRGGWGSVRNGDAVCDVPIALHLIPRTWYFFFSPLSIEIWTILCFKRNTAIFSYKNFMVSERSDEMLHTASHVVKTRNG